MGGDEPKSTGGIGSVQIFRVARFLGWRQSGGPALPGPSLELGLLPRVWESFFQPVVQEVMPHKAAVNKTGLIIPEESCGP